MKTVLNKLLIAVEAVGRLAQQLVGKYVPRSLPQGVTAFDAFVDRLIATYPLPTKDRDSIAFALASMIINLGPAVTRRSDAYFLTMIMSGAAKQIAGNVFSEIKHRQFAAAKAAAEQEAKKKEAETAATVAAQMTVDNASDLKVITA